MQPQPAAESEYWNHRIAGLGRFSGVGNNGLNERANRRRKLGQRPLVDDILATHMPEGLAGKRVLDAGCGTGIYSEHYASKGADVTGIDGAASAIEQAKAACSQATFDVASLTALPLEDASQDLVHCFSVLYHIMDDADWDAALDELFRVARTEGTVLLRTEVVAFTRTLGPYQRYRSWDRFVSAFSRNGWHVVDERAVTDMPWLKLGRHMVGRMTVNPTERLLVLKRVPSE